MYIARIENRRNKKCVQNFDWLTRRRETLSETHDDSIKKYGVKVYALSTKIMTNDSRITWKEVIVVRFELLGNIYLEGGENLWNSCAGLQVSRRNLPNIRQQT
jgi:hypothetical protein